MKAKRIFAAIVSALMMSSLVACGNENGAPGESANQTAVSVNAAAMTGYEGASIDFEDGNCAFAKEVSLLKGGDPSELVVEENNGSMALKTINTLDKDTVYIGIDIDSLLGERVSDVAVIQFSVGVLGDEFHAVSGKLYTYTGEELKETAYGDYAVYLETVNPKVITYEITEPFVSGANNYFVISKESDTGEVPTELSIDDIGFFDADGNLIEADSTVSVSYSSPIIASGEIATVLYGQRILMESEYAGDGESTALIPGEYFQDATSIMSLILEVSYEKNYESYEIAAMTGEGTMLTLEHFVGMKTSSSGSLYHIKDDGFIEVDDRANELISLTFTKEACDLIASEGGLYFEVYGITANYAVISDDTFLVNMENSYGGDWGQSAVVPAQYFEDVTENLNVTVSFSYEPDYEYYLFAPMTIDKSWIKLKESDYVGFAVKEEDPLYNLQSDGFISLKDWKNETVTFTITPEACKKISEAGGLAFQVYGVTISTVQLSTSVYSINMEAAYAGDGADSAVIPAEFFEGSSGKVCVTLNVSYGEDFDIYSLLPKSALGDALTPDDYVDLKTTGKSDLYHIEDDGTIVIDDRANTSIIFTLTDEARERIASEGGLVFEVNGVTIKTATVNDDAYTVEMERKYGGDWGQSALIPAQYFEGVTGYLNVTVNFVYDQEREYYLFAPMTVDKSWVKLNSDYYLCFEVTDEGPVYHLQSDGFISLGDWTNESVSFTLTPESCERIASAGGLAFQVYGVTLTSVVISE